MNWSGNIVSVPDFACKSYKIRIFPITIKFKMLGSAHGYSHEIISQPIVRYNIKSIKFFYVRFFHLNILFCNLISIFFSNRSYFGINSHKALFFAQHLLYFGMNRLRYRPQMYIAEFLMCRHVIL